MAHSLKFQLLHNFLRGIHLKIVKSAGNIRKVCLFIPFLGFIAHFFLQGRRNIQKALQHQRIKCTALSCQYHFDGLFMGISIFIASLTGQCVIYVS